MSIDLIPCFWKEIQPLHVHIYHPQVQNSETK